MKAFDMFKIRLLRLRYSTMLSIVLPAVLASIWGVCQAQEQRCEQRCSINNPVGSMRQLKCNDECRAEAAFCRRERE